MSREGRLYQSVLGYTSQATASASPTMLTAAASSTWRRSSTAARASAQPRGEQLPRRGVLLEHAAEGHRARHDQEAESGQEDDAAAGRRRSGFLWDLHASASFPSGCNR